MGSQRFFWAPDFSQSSKTPTLYTFEQDQFSLGNAGVGRLGTGWNFGFGGGYGFGGEDGEKSTPSISPLCQYKRRLL
ncbi:MAG: hypothetical protein CM15mP74_32780 [Halieaceae bacterium]|nr:MAG: hypothetical protein CM15mP74_32780 [Halieaceae bacterium]